MMERSSQLILFLGVFLMTLALVDANAKSVKSIFAFGDSQFDPGNNKYVKNCTLQANFAPYGSAFFHYPTGRFTNGRTVVDFVAQFLGIKFQKPYQEVKRRLSMGSLKVFPVNGLNFASAGSGILPHINNDKGVTSLQVQLKQFHGLVAHKHLHKTQISNSLFFIVSGGNDVFSYFLFPGVSKMTPRTYVRAMLKEIVRFTSKIYRHGARKIVFFSIGPVGCLPGRFLLRNASIAQCHDKMNIMARYYNTGLKRFIYRIPRMFPGAIGVYAASYDTSIKYRENPKIYGYTNINEACCGGGPLNGVLQCGLKVYKMCMTPNRYFFWDYFHPSEHTYGLISKAFWEGGKEEIWPINIKTLSRNKTSSHP
ncbi:hypothetical protein QVD17_31875 [Tagetes erecta]|uniref:Uncharacterized protein n=1 Tax=Tagetes erecta TaxID=13708 RepID=A0AAD8NP72_TARER|nr:hypothetical protein QVD17_31875 [Tagetes erecta]